MNETDALVDLESKFDESINSMSTKMMFFIHIMAQK